MRWRGDSDRVREGRPPRKAALDARIHDGIARRHGLEVGQVGLGVIVDDDARIEQAVRVQQRLDAPHQRHPSDPIPAPHRGHVAAGAVLGLERPAKAHGDELRHRIHKGAVAGHLGRIVKALGKDEVQVPLQRVAEDDRFHRIRSDRTGLAAPPPLRPSARWERRHLQ